MANKWRSIHSLPEAEIKRLQDLAANEMIPMGMARRASAMLYLYEGWSETETAAAFQTEEYEVRDWRTQYLAEGYRGWLRSIFKGEVVKIGKETIWRQEAEIVDVLLNKKPPKNAKNWTQLSISEVTGIPQQRVRAAFERLCIEQCDTFYSEEIAKNPFLYTEETLALAKKIKVRRKWKSGFTKKQEVEFLRLIGDGDGCRQSEIIAASLVGIDTKSLLNRLQEDVKFRVKVNKAKAGPKKIITDLLWKKAEGYNVPIKREKFQAELKIKTDGSIEIGDKRPSEVVKTEKHIEPDMTAIVFLATNYAPESFQRLPQAPEEVEGAIATLEISDPERARPGESLADLGELGGPLPDMPEPEDVTKHKKERAKRKELIAKREAPAKPQAPPPAPAAAPQPPPKPNWSSLADEEK